MNAAAWKTAIGTQAFDLIVRRQMEISDDLEIREDSRSAKIVRIAEEEVAAVLTAAFEVGFRAPVAAPQVSPEGTRVVFPGGQAGLTSRGLLRHWQARGHGWLVLRAEQFARAIAGPQFARAQELIMGYEAQCDLDDVDLVPGGWRGFVGGAQPLAASRLVAELEGACPTPTAQTVTRSRR